MTKIVRSLPMTIVLSAAAVSMLSGCGALRNFVELFRTADHSMRFVQQVPGPVSVAWRNERGDVWLVPKRDVLIEQIRTDAGPADWGSCGAYVVIRGHHRGTRLLVDGRWWDLQVPEDAQRISYRHEASR